MSTTFQIRSNVPCPEAPRGVGRSPKYPFAQMKAGDSFEVPLTGADDAAKMQARVRSTALSWAKRNNSPLRFAIRVITDAGDTPTAVGVWAHKKK